MDGQFLKTAKDCCVQTASGTSTHHQNRAAACIFKDDVSS